MAEDITLLIESDGCVSLVEWDAEVLNEKVEGKMLVEGGDEIGIGMGGGLNTGPPVREDSTGKLEGTVVGIPTIFAGDDMDIDENGLDESDVGVAEVSNAGENDVELILVVARGEDEGSGGDDDKDRSKDVERAAEPVDTAALPLMNNIQVNV
ncbi:hypothetical protein GQX73_g10510 [Xylaria multiplex]|uniref:Uncharacterized protein n=1 Tax=Xylaria multiplex TaxID=323545 RepID=A0A7C8MWZ4_9PEZI|nr:hypothetical protein GQX73_g10510 [Xylaria multiplex]